MMLYDGAIRFSEQPRPRSPFGTSSKATSTFPRCREIITEMLSSLKHDALPRTLHQARRRWYQYVYKKLIEANVEQRSNRWKRRSNCLKFQARDLADAARRQTSKGKARRVREKPRHPGAGFAHGSEHFDVGLAHQLPQRTHLPSSW